MDAELQLITQKLENQRNAFTTIRVLRLLDKELFFVEAVNTQDDSVVEYLSEDQDDGWETDSSVGQEGIRDNDRKSTTWFVKRFKMGESSDENETPFQLYRDRYEWRDVTPVPQDDGDEPVVAIDYTEEFKDVYDYFRAIVQSGEKSERALQLTTDAANLNPANYTVWQYKREILKALNKDLNEEMSFIEKVILTSQSKNYQVWHHRKVLVEWMNDPSKEKSLTEKVLQKDAKNYHAWQHRQWVIKTFKLYDGELDFVNDLISDDIRNNSAWNQRYFVIMGTTGFTEEVLDREIDYALSNIRVVTENESAWNYLRGVLLHDKEGLSRNAKVSNFCEELYSADNRSPFLLALIVDMCSEQVSQGTSGDSKYNLERGKQLCDDLAQKYDKIRAKYWMYLAENIEKKADSKQETNEECEK